MATKYTVTFHEAVGASTLTHTVNIIDPSFAGSATSVDGRATLSYTSDSSPLSPIRSSSLSLTLQASTTQTFSDLYSEDERQIEVEYYRGGTLLFVGWLDPEGWYEDYVNSRWTVTFDCYDGLGYLENLAYVKSDGTYYIGKQTPKEIIANCLARTGLQQDIKIAVNVAYVGLSSTSDPFDNCYMNAERFYQDDDEPMSCLDVLKSTLEVFNACITMRQGEWYVYRPNELYSSSTARFWHYDYAGVNQSPLWVDLNVAESLGSSVDTFARHHINENQQISRSKSVRNVRVKYSYGKATSLLGNNYYLYYDGSASPNGYADWTRNSTSNEILPSVGGSGITYNCINTASIKQMTSSATITIAAEDRVEFFAKVRQSVYPFTTLNSFNYKVILTGASTYYLRGDGSWSTTITTPIVKSFVGLVTDDVRVTSAPAPIAGNVTIEIWTPTGTSGLGTQQILAINLSNANDDIGNKKGEFHTAERSTDVGSKIEDEIEVFNGDNPQDTYVGAIYKTDASTNTSEWTRDGLGETKPLLQIMVEDRLRMFQDTSQIFSGDFVSGSLSTFIDFLSVCTINNVSGVFMPVEYTYDAMAGIVSLKLHELHGGELGDIVYEMTSDYGNTVKPVIKS